MKSTDIFMIALVLAISACSAPYVKPGAGSAELDADTKACAMSAAQQFPPLVQRTLVQPSQFVQGYQTCSRQSDGSSICTNTGSYLAPAVYGNADVNAKPRQSAAANCMRQRGWSKT